MEYITCNHRRSKPKVSVDVCEKCKRMKRCSDYKDYRQPFLYPGFEKEMRMTQELYRRRTREKSVKAEPTDSMDTQEQLILGF